MRKGSEHRSNRIFFTITPTMIYQDCYSKNAPCGSDNFNKRACKALPTELAELLFGDDFNSGVGPKDMEMQTRRIAQRISMEVAPLPEEPVDELFGPDNPYELPPTIDLPDPLSTIIVEDEEDQGEGEDEKIIQGDGNFIIPAVKRLNPPPAVRSLEVLSI